MYEIVTYQGLREKVQGSRTQYFQNVDLGVEL